MAIYRPAPGLNGRTAELWVLLIRDDLNFCVPSSPLRRKVVTSIKVCKLRKKDSVEHSTKKKTTTTRKMKKIMKQKKKVLMTTTTMMIIIIMKGKQKLTMIMIGEKKTLRNKTT